MQESGGFAQTLLFAVIIVFLALAAQFNSLRDPIVILVSVPMALFGALIFVNLISSLNIYTQVGLVTLMGLVSMVSPLRIRRVEALCIDCAKCAKACPSTLPVDKLVTIRSAECLGCMECVAACPAAGALLMSAPRRKRVQAWAIAAGTALLFLGITGYARWSGHWGTALPSRVYFELIPRANEFSHP